MAGERREDNELDNSPCDTVDGKEDSNAVGLGTLLAWSGGDKMRDRKATYVDAEAAGKLEGQMDTWVGRSIWLRGMMHEHW